MDDSTGLFMCIGLAIIVVIAVVVRVQAHTKQKITRAREQEARDLEVKIRMSTGLEVINDFNELALVYCQLNRLNDAELCMRKALSIAEKELGQLDPTLLPILENYASVLTKMNRTAEAEDMRRRAHDLLARQR